MLVFNVELDEDDDEDVADSGEVIEPNEPFGEDDCVDESEFCLDKLPLPLAFPFAFPFCEEMLPLCDDTLLLCVIIVVFGGALNFGIVLEIVRNLRGNTTSCGCFFVCLFVECKRE